MDQRPLEWTQINQEQLRGCLGPISGILHSFLGLWSLEGFKAKVGLFLGQILTHHPPPVRPNFYGPKWLVQGTLIPN